MGGSPPGEKDLSGVFAEIFSAFFALCGENELMIQHQPKGGRE
jgi:hypothetical protein